jgi:hypothetical protein
MADIVAVDGYGESPVRFGARSALAFVVWAGILNLIIARQERSSRKAGFYCYDEIFP